MNEFNKLLKREIARARRYAHSFSILKIDIDRLETFNEQEGRALGDRAIKDIEAIFLKTLRECDYLSAQENGIFFALLPETAVDGAVVVGERLRQAVESARFVGKAGASYLTVSIGVTEFPKDGESEMGLLQDVAKSLREAKFLGKNRVVSNYKLYHSQFFLATTQTG